ncbi:MAG: PTS transporter subunit EIIC [Oscillospiraceae bacterium]|nr:PTS transporter subunit EIIC [Oscillospiraceae bacterium]MCL2279987.1 PTS transporter subunit EIIC [Oscillospiraceae bacterium]
MAKLTNEQLSQEILRLVGGKENVLGAFNCMTRLRIKLRDQSKIDVQALKATDGVLGIVEDETFQVILGPGKAKKVCDIFIEDAQVSRDGSLAAGEIGDWEANKEAMKSGQKQSPLKRGLRTIANIFMPLIPSIIAAGIFNGFASLLSQTGAGQLAVAEQAGAMFIIITFLQLMGGAFLAHFAIFTGINAATQFGATPALGGMIGAMSIMAHINTISQTVGLFNAEVPLQSILTTGRGGIIGVIFGVWVLSKIEKRMRKIIPDTLDLVVTPVAVLICTALLFVFIIMPLAGFVSDGLVFVLGFLIASANPVISVVSGFVLAALFLPLVLLGLHHGLIPIYAVQLESLGGVTLFPVLAMAGAGQVGAAIAIYLKANKVGNKRIKSVIYGALPAGFLGVGEPLIYGVTLPMGKPFITAGLGAGFGGAFVRLMDVMSVAWGPSGLVAIPLMSTPAQMAFFAIGLVISYIMGFIITTVFIKEKDVAAV